MSRTKGASGLGRLQPRAGSIPLPYASAWAATSVAVGTIFLLSGSTRQVLLYNAASCLAAAATAVAMWRRPALRRSPWYFLLAGQALQALGDVLYFHHEALFGFVPDGLGYANPAYLAGLTLLALAMAKLGRARSGALPHALDAFMVVTTAGLLTWAFLIRPVLVEATTAGAEQALAVTYALGGVAVIGLTAWFALAPGSRSPGSLGLALGYGLWFVATIVYGHQALTGTYVAGSWLDVGYIVSYFGIGFAALHPTLPSVADPAPRRRLGGERRQMIVVAAAALVGPAVVAMGALTRLDLHVVDVTLACAVLFVLAVTRMVGLISALDHSLVRLQKADGERAGLLDALVKASESERASLAVELHDGPIQHLVTVGLRLELALMALERGETTEARREVGLGQSGLEAEVDELRNLMVGLRPPALGERGLVDAAADHLRSFSDRSGVQASLSAQLPARIHESGETVLFRVLQESLSNVQKHAGARNVEVSIVGDADSVALVVRDDGAGFDPSDPRTAARPGHLGIVGMRERVELAGGTFLITSAPGRGTVVRAVLPGSDRRGEECDVATAGASGR